MAAAEASTPELPCSIQAIGAKPVHSSAKASQQQRSSHQQAAMAQTVDPFFQSLRHLSSARGCLERTRFMRRSSERVICNRCRIPR